MTNKVYDVLSVVRARRSKILHAIWYIPETEGQVNVLLCGRGAAGYILEPKEGARVTCKRCLKSMAKI